MIYRRQKLLITFTLFALLTFQKNKDVFSLAQPVAANSEFTLRSTNSVDIQVCASSILSDERDGVQLAIQAQLQFALGSTTSVYYTRAYTTNLGTICFLYVYQASSPDMAKNSIPILLNNEATFSVQYRGFDISCAIAAVPWQGEGYGPLGPDIPWQWTGTDVILWGGSTAGILLSCTVAMCCFVSISLSRERKRASDILKSDRHLLGDLLVAMPSQDKKVHLSHK